MSDSGPVVVGILGGIAALEVLLAVVFFLAFRDRRLKNNYNGHVMRDIALAEVTAVDANPLLQSETDS